MSQQDVETLRRGWDAWNRGDLWRFRKGSVIHFESFLDREQALQAAAGPFGRHVEAGVAPAALRLASLPGI